MFYNENYFNQTIVTYEPVQRRLAEFTRGLDMAAIFGLIDEDIAEKHAEDEIFDGEIHTPNFNIVYSRAYNRYNALYVSDELAQLKSSKITITSDDIYLYLAGDDSRLIVRRKTDDDERKIDARLYPNGLIEVEYSEAFKQQLDMKKVNGDAKKKGTKE